MQLYACICVCAQSQALSVLWPVFPGVQRQIVHCVEKTTGMVEEHLCDPLTRPDDNRTSCNKEPCPAMWVLSAARYLQKGSVHRHILRDRQLSLPVFGQTVLVVLTGVKAQKPSIPVMCFSIAEEMALTSGLDFCSRISSPQKWYLQ